MRTPMGWPGAEGDPSGMFVLIAFYKQPDTSVLVWAS